MTTSLKAVLVAGLACASPALLATEPAAGSASAPARDDDGTTTVVTATRAPRPLRDVPATTVLIPRREIERSPTLTTDEVLRTVPSVATFRRSPSLTADPSSQGLNLRGLGPSGASRSLVLVDGVPQNDPFGGWVYWRSMPRLGIDHIEIVPGGGSALYGSAALGGVVQIVSRPIDASSVDGELAVGPLQTAFGAARVAERAGPVGIALEGEALGSGGHVVTAPESRGPIDRRAPSAHETLNGRVDWDVSSRLHLRFRAGGFFEHQSGGTPFTTAAVSLGSASAMLQWDLGAGVLQATWFGRVERFEQTRARVDEGRAHESLSGARVARRAHAHRRRRRAARRRQL